MKILISSQRHLFDIPNDIAYFNCAYNSPQLNESQSRLLKARNIYVSQRGNVRFAPHLHVSGHDLERLLSALCESIK